MEVLEKLKVKRNDLEGLKSRRLRNRVIIILLDVLITIHTRKLKQVYLI